MSASVARGGTGRHHIPGTCLVGDRARHTRVAPESHNGTRDTCFSASHGDTRLSHRIRGSNSVASREDMVCSSRGPVGTGGIPASGRIRAGSVCTSASWSRAGPGLVPGCCLLCPGGFGAKKRRPGFKKKHRLSSQPANQRARAAAVGSSARAAAAGSRTARGRRRDPVC